MLSEQRRRQWWAVVSYGFLVTDRVSVVVTGACDDWLVMRRYEVPSDAPGNSDDVSNIRDQVKLVVPLDRKWRSAWWASSGSCWYPGEMPRLCETRTHLGVKKSVNTFRWKDPTDVYGSFRYTQTLTPNSCISLIFLVNSCNQNAFKRDLWTQKKNITHKHEFQWTLKRRSAAEWVQDISCFPLILSIVVNKTDTRSCYDSTAL